MIYGPMWETGLKSEGPGFGPPIEPNPREKGGVGKRMTKNQVDLYCAEGGV